MSESKAEVWPALFMLMRCVCDAYWIWCSLITAPRAGFCLNRRGWSFARGEPGDGLHRARARARTFCALSGG
jgi:hypothetical protein